MPSVAADRKRTDGDANSAAAASAEVACIREKYFSTVGFDRSG
jgi:hypothetical protein